MFDLLIIIAWLLYIQASERYIQGGKKSLSIAITDEFYTFDLMEIHVENLPQNFEINIFFLLHSILLITKMQRKIRSHPNNLLKNGKKVF